MVVYDNNKQIENTWQHVHKTRMQWHTKNLTYIEALTKQSLDNRNIVAKEKEKKVNLYVSYAYKRIRFSDISRTVTMS